MTLPLCLIFKTCDPKLRGLDFDDNFLPIINKRNADICNVLIDNDKKYNSKVPQKIFNRIKTSRPSLKNVPQSDWESLISVIRNINHTRTSNKAVNAFARYLFTNSKIIDDIINGRNNAVDDILTFLKGNPVPISLASKVCKWIYRWNKNGRKDAYAIYDSVVRSVIPYYAKHFGVTINHLKDLDDYVKYDKIVKDISKNSNVDLHNLDHILWYFFKSNPIQREIAIALGE